MTRAIKHVAGSRAARFGLAGMVALAIGAMPLTAFAGRFDRGHDDGRQFEARRDQQPSHGRIDIQIGSGPRSDWDTVPARPARVWVEPVYRTVTQQVWVEPVYQTVTDHVWREASVQQQTEQVWVPDRYELRDVTHFDAWGRPYIVRQPVLVEAGHYQQTTRQVVVPAHYEDVQRQVLVSAGHWQMVQRQELVTPGHWELCPAPVIVRPERHDGLSAWLHVSLPIH